MTILFMVVILVMAGISGAVVSRMCGGGKPHIGHGLEQFLYALPYILFGDGLVKLIVYAGAVIGKRMGHGQYHGIFGKRRSASEDEQFDFIVKLFFGEDKNSSNRWKRNLFGLFLSGIFPVLMAVSITVISGDYIAALVLFIGGALKPVVYLASYKMGYKTEGGEYLTGLAGWLTALSAFIIINYEGIFK